MGDIELKNYLKLAEIEDREEALKERAEKAEKALKEALAMIENLKKNN